MEHTSTVTKVVGVFGGFCFAASVILVGTGQLVGHSATNMA
jgi:hypothetical protein